VSENNEEHRSDLRYLMAQAAGVSYVSYASLAAAREDDAGCVIFEGDYGGQIYLAAPARAVSCDEKALDLLLRDLDALCWDDEEGRRVVYEQRPAGTGVAGGMGGGMVAADGWIHPEIAELGIVSEIRDVLAARRPRLSAAARASTCEQTGRRTPLP
jgi:hypothetical protein